MSDDKGLPPWFWVGCGCLGAVGVLVGGLMGLGVFGVYKAKELGDAMADPAKREKAALDVLGADELPEGYYSIVAVSVPFVFDIAVLTDRPPDDDGQIREPGENGFVFFSFLQMGDADDELYDFFEGRTDDVDALGTNMEIEIRERIDNGRVDRSDDEILWVTHRGRVENDQFRDSRDGLVTLMLLDCDSDERRRLGLWFGPDPSPDAETADLDLSGTVGDPAGIDAFMSPIRPCP